MGNGAVRKLSLVFLVFVTLLAIFSTTRFVVADPSDDVYEENDSSSSAYSISKGIYNQLSLWDEDWYSINLVGNENVTITLTISDIFYTSLVLYRQNYGMPQIVTYGTKISSSLVISEFNLKSGLYYIRIYSLMYANLNYTLSITDIIDDRFEENDDPQSLGESQHLNFSYYDDLLLLDKVDYFKITINAGKGVGLVLTKSDSVSTYNISLIGPDPHTDILSSVQSEESLAKLYYFSESGLELFIKISSPTNQFFKYTLDVQLVEEDEFEENDYIDDAKSLLLDNNYRLSLLDKNDWFKVNLVQNSYISILIEAIYEGIIDVFIYDPDFALLNTSDYLSCDENGNFQQIFFYEKIPISGYYYVRIFSIRNKTNQYEITLTHIKDDNFEDNDDVLTSKTISYGIINNLMLLDESDWYNINLNINSNISISFASVETYENFEVSFYDVDGSNRLGYDYGISQYKSICIPNITQTGTYYLKINSSDGDWGNYTLNIGQIPNLVDSYEDNDENFTAQVITKAEQQMGGPLQGSCYDDDWFSIFLNNNEDLKISLYSSSSQIFWHLLIEFYDIDGFSLINRSLDCSLQSNTREIVYNGGSEGVYYIRVFSNGTYSEQDYQLYVRNASFYDEFEDNDDIKNAVDLTPLGSLMSELGDEDWYNITSTAGTGARVCLMVPSFKEIENISVKLWSNRTGTLQEEYDCIPDTTGMYNIFLETLPVSVNYSLNVFKIFGYDYPIQYQLAYMLIDTNSFDLIYGSEPNNGKGESYLLGTSGSSGYFVNSTDEDWSNFTLDIGQVCYGILSNYTSTSTVQLSLIDKDGVSILDTGHSILYKSLIPATMIVFSPKTPGSYSFLVSASTFGSYFLRTGVVKLTNLNDVEVIKGLNYSLHWNLNQAIDPQANATLFIDGEINKTEIFDLTTGFSLEISNLSIGMHTIFVSVNAGYGVVVNDSLNVVIINSTPIITERTDLALQQYFPNKDLIWTSFSAIVNSPYYQIVVRNETLNIIEQLSGAWTSGVPLSLNINTNSIGNFSYEITFYDGCGGSKVDSVGIEIYTNITLLQDLSVEISNLSTTLLDWSIDDRVVGLTNYNITLDGVNIVQSNTSWPGINPYSFSYNLAGLSIGTHSVEIRADDGIGDFYYDCVLLNVTNLEPVLNNPFLSPFEINSTGISIYWIMTDPSVSISGRYNITLNNQIVAMNLSYPSPNGHEYTLAYNFDNALLILGTNQIEIFCSDGYNAYESDSLFFSTLNFDPILQSSHHNASIPIIEHFHIVNWTLQDMSVNKNIAYYNISVNEMLVTAPIESFPGEWQPHTYNFTILLDGILVVGLNNITLCVFDGFDSYSDFTIQIIAYDTTPVVTDVGNIEYVAGEQGDFLIWTVYDALVSGPAEYDITRTGFTNLSGYWISGGEIQISIDGLNVGTYLFRLFAYDNSRTECGIDEVQVVVQNSNPEIINPSNITILYGTPYNLTWTIIDYSVNSSACYNISYNGQIILLNTQFPSGSNDMYNVTLNLSLIEMIIGENTFVIYALDGYGANISDNITIVVLNEDPLLSSSGDVQFSEGSKGNSIVWLVTDMSVHSGTYIITGENIENTMGTWVTGDRISFSLDQLKAGIYTITITIYDGLGAVQSNTVLVEVQPNPNNNVSTIIIGIVIISGAIISVTIFIKVRKRNKIKN